MDLRVLIVTHEYPPFIYGGLGTYIYDIAKLLHKNNIDVVVLTASYPKNTKRTSFLVEDVNNRVLVMRMQLGDYPFKTQRFGTAVRSVIKKIIKEYKIDTVHTNPFYLGEFIKEIKRYARIVISMHGSWYASLKHFVFSLRAPKTLRFMVFDYKFFIPYMFSPINEIVLRKELILSDSIIAPSIHTKNEIIVSYKVNEKKTSVIRPVIIAESGCNNKDKFAYEIINDDTPTFIYAGRLTIMKGIIELLETLLDINRDLRLYIFGDGPCKIIIKQFKRKLAEKLIYMGKVKPKVWQLHASCTRRSFFVYPSYWEAAPRALLEAYALGRPAIVSKLDWAFEYGVFKQALFADIFNKHNFKRVLEEAIEIMNSSKEYSKMSLRAKNYIHIFHDRTKIFRKLVKVYTGETSD